MEPRKIIRLGNSSYAIALPKDWVDKAGLKKGDSIYILPNSNGELIVAPKYYDHNRNKTKIVDLSHSTAKNIVHELRSAFIQDNDIVEIKGITKKNEELIKGVLQREMMGFEPLGYQEGKLSIKDFFNIQEVQLETFLRKADNSIRSMFEDLLKLMKESPIKEKEYLEMYHADLDINRLYLLITRIFFKGLDDPSVLNVLNTDAKSLFGHWWITFNLEHIADEIKKITYLLRSKEIKRQDITKMHELCKKMNENYVSTLNFYYKHEIQLSQGLLENTDYMRQTLNRLANEESGVAREFFVRLLAINRAIYEINKILFYVLT